MKGCPECGKFRVVAVTVDRDRAVGGQRYQGKLPVYRCRNCAEVFIDPEVEKDFNGMVQRVATGLEAERENLFRIRRAPVPSTGGWWSALLAGLRAH